MGSKRKKEQKGKGVKKKKIPQVIVEEEDEEDESEQLAHEARTKRRADRLESVHALEVPPVLAEDPAALQVQGSASIEALSVPQLMQPYPTPSSYTQTVGHGSVSSVLFG